MAKCENTLITVTSNRRPTVISCGIRGRAGEDATGSAPDVINFISKSNTLATDDPDYSSTDVGDLALLFESS